MGLGQRIPVPMEEQALCKACGVRFHMNPQLKWGDDYCCEMCWQVANGPGVVPKGIQEIEEMSATISKAVVEGLIGGPEVVLANRMLERMRREWETRMGLKYTMLEQASGIRKAPPLGSLTHPPVSRKGLGEGSRDYSTVAVSRGEMSQRGHRTAEQRSHSPKRLHIQVR